jgi:hypothetical protein
VLRHAVLWPVQDNIPYTITMVPVIEYLASAGLGLDIKVYGHAYLGGLVLPYMDVCFGEKWAAFWRSQ